MIPILCVFQKCLQFYCGPIFYEVKFICCISFKSLSNLLSSPSVMLLHRVYLILHVDSIWHQQRSLPYKCNRLNRGIECYGVFLFMGGRGCGAKSNMVSRILKTLKYVIIILSLLSKFSVLMAFN